MVGGGVGCGYVGDHVTLCLGVLGGAGQEENPRVAPGLPHHGPLRHRLLDLLHRAARGGARYCQGY